MYSGYRTGETQVTGLANGLPTLPTLPTLPKIPILPEKVTVPNWVILLVIVLFVLK